MPKEEGVDRVVLLEEFNFKCPVQLKPLSDEASERRLGSLLRCSRASSRSPPPEPHVIPPDDPQNSDVHRRPPIVRPRHSFVPIGRL